MNSIKNYTIKDVAKRSNCSISTVSRALNNKGRISEETRQRILAVARELNYQPNTAARSLAMSNSLTLGLVVSDITNVFYAEMADIVQKTALNLGYSVIIVCDNDKISYTKFYVDFLLSRGVDGIIFGSARLNDPVINNLVKNNFPLVLINRRIRKDNANCVMVDNVKGATLLTEHLLDLGYKKIAFISGPAQFSPSIDRLEGYSKALTDRGISLRNDYIMKSPSFKKEGGISLAKKLLQLDDPPQAIFAVNDTIALGALEGIQEMGLSVPEDITLVGFDDIAFSSLHFIQLTTVSQRLNETAKEAVKILINIITKKKVDTVHKIIMEPILKIRKSCGSNR